LHLEPIGNADHDGTIDTREDTMRARSRLLTLSAVVAVALAGACASEDDAFEVAPTLPESMEPVGDGWTWKGEGEAPSFAAADSYCQRFTATANPGLANQLQKEQEGGTIASARITQRDRRSYWSCMESRGWGRAGG
jgi:hypothetical protein